MKGTVKWFNAAKGFGFIGRYPEDYRKGDEISFDEALLKDIILFHNGLKFKHSNS